MTALAVDIPSRMNKTESEYASMLRQRVMIGEVKQFWFEGMTLKLAHDLRYTPDFLVVLANNEIELHETKGGFVREDAWQKLKTAASMFPFRFLLCQKKNGVWSIKRVPKDVVSSGAQGAVSTREASPRVGAGRKPKIATEAQLVAWKAGDPLPAGYTLMGGKLVTVEFAMEKARAQ